MGWKTFERPGHLLLIVRIQHFHVFQFFFLVFHAYSICKNPMFSLSRLPRIWLTAGVAVTIVGLLLIGFRSHYPRQNPTFYTPPPITHETKPDNVDDHDQAPPTGVTETRPAGIRPSQHTPTEQSVTSDSQSLEGTRNATLGVREDQIPLELGSWT